VGHDPGGLCAYCRPYFLPIDHPIPPLHGRQAATAEVWAIPANFATSQVAAEEHSESRPCLRDSRPTASPSFDQQDGHLSNLPPLKSEDRYAAPPQTVGKARTVFPGYPKRARGCDGLGRDVVRLHVRSLHSRSRRTNSFDYDLNAAAGVSQVTMPKPLTPE
jgi:hypothetical protein